MKKRSHYHEINDIIVQFLAAFDDVIINRYDKDRNAKQEVEVRYVFAPKQRVMYDVINKAQTLKLPVVSVDIRSISRDESRVFNKLTPSFIPSSKTNTPDSASKFLMPVPIDIELNMSIMARYMADADQIISNFIPYNNPYIIISWKVPEEYGTTFDQEIRSPVIWSGSLVYNTPTDSTYSDKFRVVIDTSFTIKAWLFPEKSNTQATIYKVESNFINVDLANRIYDLEGKQLEFLTYEQQGYNALSSYNTNVPTSYTETVVISAIPEFTNIFYSTTGAFVPIRETVIIDSGNDNNFTLYGKRFDYNNTFYLSSYVDNFFTDYTEITSAKSPTISAYQLDSRYFSIGTDNIANVYIPRNTFLSAGEFTIITANEAGWATTYQAQSSILRVGN